MNPFVFHLVSGDAFFTGNMLLAVALSGVMSNRKFVKRLAFVCALLGLLLIAMTAVPSGNLYFLCWLALGFYWSVGRLAFKESRRFKMGGLVATLMFVCVAMLCEFTWRKHLQFGQPESRTLIIFADSLTAGIGENEAETWPKLLSEEHNLDVVDHSRMGATVGSELKRLDQLNIPSGLVLIELGGNDLLGSTTVADFERQLDQFLSEVTTSNQLVIMLELPVPPLFNRFGSVQRRLARKHAVQLIPKRELAKVLAGPENTLDSIHLTQAGHEQMAKTVWKQISSAFAEDESEF